MKYGSYMVWPVRRHLKDQPTASTAERYGVDKNKECGFPCVGGSGRDRLNQISSYVQVGPPATSPQKTGAHPADNDR
jgi:hypothetical protein